LADAHGSGPCTRKGVGVRVPSSAPSFFCRTNSVVPPKRGAIYSFRSPQLLFHNDGFIDLIIIIRQQSRSPECGGWQEGALLGNRRRSPPKFRCAACSLYRDYGSLRPARAANRNLQVAFIGSPVQENVTAPEYPPMGVIVIVSVTEEPGATLSDVVLGATTTVGGTGFTEKMRVA
jgi:hypothetical protein